MLRSAAGYDNFDNCYSQELIKVPKTFHIQNISGILPALMITADSGKIIAQELSTHNQPFL
jgi:hypothetical protein